ncbi:hypothetical protein B0T12DRAFT_214339 [Alternaria alternata]|nr:hypothetical protein B0T12DRAFT_214339 [Alternaria alternata]
MVMGVFLRGFACCGARCIVWAGSRPLPGNLGLLRDHGRAWKCLESSLARRSLCICNIPVTTFKSTSVAPSSHSIYTRYCFRVVISFPHLLSRY